MKLDVRFPRQTSTAFTLTDLMLLLAAFALLILMHLPAWGNTRRNANAALCLSHKQQLTRAWRLYADDNHDRLVGNLEGGNVLTLANSNRTWVLGFLDYSGGGVLRANTDTRLLTVYSPLAPYANRSAAIFKCPEDQFVSGANRTPRVRSISMNAYLGERASPFNPGYRQYKKVTELVDPHPSSIWVFLDEHSDSINDGFFVVDMTGYPSNSAAAGFLDYPAPYHSLGAGISFADGHAEMKTWLDGRTTPAVRFFPIVGAASPNNRDIFWLQQRTTARLNSP